jgi:hypothetical protein
MGYRRDMLYRCKLRIAKAARTIVLYDLGYKKVTGKYALEEWLKKIEDSFSFSSAKNVFRSKHKGKTSYTDRITAVYPTYLHDLWRHATTLLGDNATFEEIAIQMNLQSTTEVFLPTLALIKWSLHRWFKKNKKLLSLVKTKIIETYATGCI